MRRGSVRNARAPRVNRNDIVPPGKEPEPRCATNEQRRLATIIANGCERCAFKRAFVRRLEGALFVSRLSFAELPSKRTYVTACTVAGSQRTITARIVRRLQFRCPRGDANEAGCGRQKMGLGSDMFFIVTVLLVSCRSEPHAVAIPLKNTNSTWLL